MNSEVPESECSDERVYSHVAQYQAGLKLITLVFGMLFAFSVLSAASGLLSAPWLDFQNRVFFKTKNFVVATRNIPEGETLSAGDLKITELNMQRPQNSFPNQLTDVIGKRTVHAIPADQLVLPYHFGIGE